MECFIKKIWQDRADKQVHRQFIRFGKGSFAGRAALFLQKTTKIKLRGSFEYVNDFVVLVSELTEARFSGIILSKEELPDLSFKKKKKEIFEYEVSDLQSHKIQEIKDKVYVMLLDASASDITLKMKKRLPKPGRSGEGKVDDKFCQLEADLKYWQSIREAFMLPECKKTKISHIYNIGEIILPEGEKDFAKIREQAKRKGKITRKLEVDKKEMQEEKEFVA